MKNSPLRNKERTAEWRKKEPELMKRRVRKSQLWTKFRMTIDQYDKMLEEQKGVCAICNAQCISTRQLAVDHCHKTGVIRGLLCMHCNQGLGKFRDNIDLLKQAVEYLTGRKYG